MKPMLFQSRSKIKNGKLVSFRKNIPVEIPHGYQFSNYQSVTNPISSLLKLTQQKEY